MTVTHELKVEMPYFQSLADGTKRFEVRKNDRGYQRGDHLILREWHPAPLLGDYCDVPRCGAYSSDGEHAHTDKADLYFEVSFVYSGDPRFNGHGGLQPGYVVLALSPLVSSLPTREDETP